MAHQEEEQQEEGTLRRQKYSMQTNHHNIMPDLICCMEFVMPIVPCIYWTDIIEGRIMLIDARPYDNV